MGDTNQKSVKYNFIMNFILTASSILFPLITFPYVSRVLLVEGNGIVTFAVSITTYFSMFAALGIPTYGIRACAKVRDNKEQLSKTVQELLIINSVTTVVVFAAFLLSIFLVPKFQSQKLLFLINGITIVLNTVGVNWFYSALEKYRYITIRSLVFKIISILLMFLLVKQTSDYVLYGAILVFAAAGSNVLNFINLRKYISFRKSQPYDFRKHMKPILIFFGTSAAASIYTNLDIAMLGFLRDDIAVGYYNVGIKVKTICVSLVTSLGAVLLPRLSYYMENQKIKEFKYMVSKAVNFVFLLSVPIVVYFILFAKEAVLLLSGPAFLDAVLPMQIMMPTILLIGLSNITGIQTLVPLNKEKELLISMIVGAGVNLVLNLFTIHFWGTTGAAISNLTAESVVLIVQCIYLRKHLASVLSQIKYYKIALATVLGSLLALVAGRWVDGVFWKLAVTAAAFFPLYLVVLLLCKEKFIMENILPLMKKCVGIKDQAS